MKTTNVILIGVVGVGAVGAYMYMKNKKAQDNLLSGSLPAPATSQGGFVATPTTSQGGFVATPTTSQGGFVATPTTSQGGGFATAPATSGASTTPVLSTTTDGVSPSDANLNLANATVLVGQRAELIKTIKRPLPSSISTSYSSGGFFGNASFSQTMQQNSVRASALIARKNAQTQLVALDKKLANLGYKVDATGKLVQI
jgi:hypothetical protein